MMVKQVSIHAGTLQQMEIQHTKASDGVEKSSGKAHGSGGRLRVAFGRTSHRILWR